MTKTAEGTRREIRVVELLEELRGAVRVILLTHRSLQRPSVPTQVVKQRFRQMQFIVTAVGQN
jgi:hypothetical protein